ncbi:Uncharacterised protein [Mycobacteroides abscessus]|nr:Uncharacterised protein [Mycobacteroides abscessus]
MLSHDQFLVAILRRPLPVEIHLTFLALNVADSGGRTNEFCIGCRDVGVIDKLVGADRGNQ